MDVRAHEDGTYWVCVENFGPVGFRAEQRPEVLAAAWAHHEERNDPPGLRVDSEEADWLVQVLDLPPWDAPGHVGPSLFFGTEDAARAAAWAWYWRRVAVAEALDAATAENVASFPPGDDPFDGAREPVWPHSLAWSDEQVAKVERWLAEGGEVPEVLHG